jgi:ribosomal protein S18 acetylase RimI-like enzyme
MSVDIRAVRPEEYERVGALTVAAYRLLPVDHLWGGYDRDILDVAGRVHGADVLVAVDDEKLLGAVTFVGDEGSPWLEWTQPGEVQFRLLAVDAAARGKGIGETLVRACLARADGRPVLIHTTQWMEAARRLYERLGFERRPERDVAQAAWYDSERDHDLPPEWQGVTFLAYAYG